jgi:hypothetical protein
MHQHEVRRTIATAGLDAVEHERGQQSQHDNRADVPGSAKGADTSRGRASGVDERQVPDQRRRCPRKDESNGEGQRRPRTGDA